MSGAFLGISKAFGKVWHEGLIFKSQSYGIEGNLLILLNDNLEDGKQSVILNAKMSSWKNILAGVHKFRFWDPFVSDT